MADDYETCATCGAEFVVADTGDLGCWFHPAKMNMETLHYPCCGASEYDGACRVHAQNPRRTPQGCHRIDHFGDIEARLAVVNHRPYAVVPLEQVLAQTPELARPDGHRVFHISQESDLDDARRALTVRVPETWPGKGNHSGRLDIDLRQEHVALRQALLDRERESVMLTDVTDPYELEWERRTQGIQASSVPNFVPFVLFLRMDSGADSTRAARRSAPCAY